MCRTLLVNESGIDAVLLGFVLAGFAGIGSAEATRGRDLPVEHVTYGFHPSLAADDVGHLHLSFYDGDKLQYGEWDGVSWSFEHVDARHGHTGQYSSLRVDDAAVPHIVYSDFRGEDILMYAVKSGGAWPLTEVKQASLLHQTSLGMAGADELWASYGIFPYYNNSYRELQYAHFDGAAWTTGLIDNESHSGSRNSLAIDPLSGKPKVAYSVTVGEVGDRVKYAAWNGTSWETETIESGRFSTAPYNAIQVDSSGKAHVIYVDRNKNLRYAVRRGAPWDIETIAQDAVTGAPVRLRLDADDRPHIAFLTGEVGQPTDVSLIYGVLKTDWRFIACVEHSSTIETWQALDLELDSDANPHIIFTYTGKSGRGLYHVAIPAECAGKESIKKARCKKKRGVNKLTVRLKGGVEGDTFTVKLTSGEEQNGVLNEKGKGKAKFSGLASGPGTATATWGCGARAEKDYGCP